MGSESYGSRYWIVGVSRDLSSEEYISFMADDVSISPNGDLITTNHGKDQNDKFIGLLIPRGKWTYCHAASLIDGHAVTVNHWHIEESFQDAKTKERNKMNQSLRYDILKRDDFKCTICGRSAQDGITLHVDHDIPISKGGKTEKSNLKTLCSICNQGKGAKI